MEEVIVTKVDVMKMIFAPTQITQPTVKKLFSLKKIRIVHNGIITVCLKQ